MPNRSLEDQERERAEAEDTTAAADPAQSPLRLAAMRRRLVQRRAERRDAGIKQGAADTMDRAASSAGTPLPPAARQKFERSLGVDLGAVRVHTGSDSSHAADAVGARAYTTGQDIHFNHGEYDPASAADSELVAHEVAHTVQQAGTSGNTQCKLEVSEPGDSAEVEADVAASAMLAGDRASVHPAQGVMRRPKGFPAPPRQVTGKDGYLYEQRWDGSIIVLKDPSGMHLGTFLPKASQWNQEITEEIGEYCDPEAMRTPGTIGCKDETNAHRSGEEPEAKKPSETDPIKLGKPPKAPPPSKSKSKKPAAAPKPAPPEKKAEPEAPIPHEAEAKQAYDQLAPNRGCLTVWENLAADLRRDAAAAFAQGGLDALESWLETLREMDPGCLRMEKPEGGQSIRA